MAYWIIPFTSFSGVKYEVRISGKSGSDETLQAAVNPFILNEEGDGDLFVPVKTQSGYIRIVTADINTVNSIIPTSGGSRTVMLYRIQNYLSTVIWRGYVQPKLFSFNLWQGEQVVSIPVECCLSALKYRTAGTSANYPYINEILYTMMVQFRWGYWYFQCSAFTDDNADADLFWLNKRIPSSNIGGRSYFDILKDICNFYGWTCRSCGTTVYFLKYRNVDSAISGYLYRGNSTTVYNISHTPEYSVLASWINATLNTNAFADRKARMLKNEGAHRVVMTSELEPYDVELATDVSEFKQAVYDGTWAPSRVDVGNTYYYEAFEDITVSNMVISGFNAYGELGPITPGHTDIQDRTMTFHVLITNRNSANPYLGWITFQTTNSYSFPAGRMFFKFEGASSVVEFTIKVRNKWYKWNGNGSNGEWVDEEPTDPANHITYDPSSELGEFAVIYTDTSRVGTLTIKVYDPSGVTGLSDITFNNIIFTFTADQNGQYNGDKTSLVYSQETGTNFEGDKNLESRFALKDNTTAMSMNMLLNADLTPCLKLYNGLSSPVAFNPLQDTVNEAAEELANMGDMIEVNLLENVQGEVTPLTLMYISQLSAYYYPVSISRDYGEGIVKLKLIKRNN